MADKAWGKQMMLAIQAVRGLHTDASRLLLDLDRGLVGYRSVYGSFATMDLSYDIKRGTFMSNGLLRHWLHNSQPDAVIAVNIAFWDDRGKVTEPLFIAAKLLYTDQLEKAGDRTKAWDPWYAYLDWTTPRLENEVSEAQPPAKRQDLRRAITIGVPLCSVTTEAHGHELIERVRNFAL